ncbi:reverse transcriptase-like protein [Elysia marginata]|uniref:Reverse transcriptase-like protein n=1 Tax=Elysia marginata TaxID=1093978 RepID=A0AAV4I1Z4_9GAST|nr:reverse transcriptase-like protein [Elysia marginata]
MSKACKTEPPEYYHSRSRARTTWGADSSVLRQVYTGIVRPIMEYGNTTWATAAKTNTTRLCEVQNAGLRLITGAMKTTGTLI